MRVTILGKRWNLRFARINDYGRCDSPDTPGKTITIRDTLKGESLLHVLLHELLHSADWHKDEEWVEHVSKDIARILTSLGYQRIE